MMIKTTVMSYGHGPNGMMELTFNEKALDCWEKSLNTSSIMEKNLLTRSKHFKRREPSPKRRLFTNYRRRERSRKNTKLFVNLYPPFLS